jgi:hypothetical protein
MTTFVLLSKVAAALAGEMTDLVAMDELFDREVIGVEPLELDWAYDWSWEDEEEKDDRG